MRCHASRISKFPNCHRYDEYWTRALACQNGAETLSPGNRGSSKHAEYNAIAARVGEAGVSDGKLAFGAVSVTVTHEAHTSDGFSVCHYCSDFHDDRLCRYSSCAGVSDHARRFVSSSIQYRRSDLPDAVDISGTDFKLQRG